MVVRLRDAKLYVKSQCERIISHTIFFN